jgi:alcohol dehydrogenase class IV
MDATARVRHQPVRYGVDAIMGTPDVVARLGAHRVLLVCGGRSFEASGAARMLPALERVATVVRWSGFAPNTDAADLTRGLELAARLRPDLVLGVGGGSAMDMAKLLCAYVDLSGSDTPATVAASIRSGAVAPSGPRLVLAPTTSGTGSEATHFAVVYIGAEKFSVGAPRLRPDVAILDPALSLSGSRYQRATSGIDAVAQAIESLWAVAATDTSRRWAERALDLLLPAIEPFVRKPTEECARAMAIGSHLAGRAIDISRTTAAHAMSYAITKRYGVSHGHAVALTLGHFIEAHAAAGTSGAGLRHGVDPQRHRRAMAEVLTRLGAADGAGARARFTALVHRLGLTPWLSQVAANRSADIGALVTAVNVERLGNNPVEFDEGGLAEILRRAEQPDMPEDGQEQR